VAFSEELADRVRDLIFERDGVTERKMFGGIVWMVNGNMAVGVTGDDLMVRQSPEDVEVSLAEPHVGPMEMSGKTMKGFLIVREEGIQEDGDLEDWVEAGASFAAYMPPK